MRGYRSVADYGLAIAEAGKLGPLSTDFADGRRLSEEGEVVELEIRLSLSLASNVHD